MDDSIFDKVDKLISEDSSPEDEKSFNESELEDIMSEIEDLEKEFEADSSMNLQEKIDAEMDTAVKATVPAPQVLTIANTPTKATSKIIKSSGSEVSFAAHGEMKLNLDFKIGEETAILSIDPLKGLVVTMTGVEICINEDSGCTVNMDNGMNFTIPLSLQKKSLKKKAV